MRFRRYFRRLLLAGAFAGASWAPAAGAATVDQVGGQLVPSSQLSSLQNTQPTQALPLRLLPSDDLAQLRGGNSQIGGYSSSAVPQSYLSKLPADVQRAFTKYQPGSRAALTSSGSSSSFDWRDTVIGLVAFVGTCAVLGAAYLTRRRASLRPA
jgi:hypothetical protein